VARSQLYQRTAFSNTRSISKSAKDLLVVPNNSKHEHDRMRASGPRTEVDMSLFNALSPASRPCAAAILRRSSSKEIPACAGEERNNEAYHR